MAEVVGLITGVAGLTPLVAGVIGGIRRLRRIRKDSTEIPNGLNALIRDLEFLQWAMEITNPTLDAFSANYCQKSITAVVKGIEELLDKFPMKFISSGKKPGLKEAWDLRHWEEDVKSLRKTVSQAKQDLGLCLQFAPRTLRVKNPGISSSSETSSSSGSVTESEALSSFSPIKYTPPRRVLRQDCTLKACSCSCHRISRISRRFWALDYTGLFPPCNTCDQPSCTASAYGFRLRVALSQLGIPWSVTMGLCLSAEIRSFSIQPALQVKPVVKYTSPGFEIIWRLKHRLIKVDEACMEFRRLAQEDPSLHLHVDPSGSSYVETLLEQPWGDIGLGILHFRGGLDDQLSLLQVLMSELKVTLGMGNKSFLVSCARWSNNSAHLALLETALGLGFDPTTIDSPLFSEWSGAWLCWPWAQDPLLLKFLTLLCKDNQGFAGMTPLHEAVLFGQLEDVQRWAAKSEKNQRNVLGQTPLHLAVSKPQHLQAILDADHDPDALDQHGNTPLMYAAASNVIDAAKRLIRAGANPFIPQITLDSDLAKIMIDRTNWDFVVDLFRFLDDETMQTTAEMLAKEIVSLLFVRPSDPDGWGGSDYLPQLLSRCKSLNFCLENPAGLRCLQVVKDRTLLHYARSAKEVDTLLGHGLTMIKQVDQEGQHALMSAITKAHIFDLEPLVERLLDAGADINLQDKRGHTACHMVMQHLSKHRNWPSKGGIDCLDTLVTRGADFLILDNCRCSCSVSGCLPLVPDREKNLSYFEETPETSAILLMESIILVFETCGMNTAKQILLATIRRGEHKKLGMTHTCCGNNTNYPGHYPDPVPEDDIDDILEEESEFIRILDEKMEHEAKREFNCLLRSVILDAKPSMNQIVQQQRSSFSCNIAGILNIDRYHVDRKNDRFVPQNEPDPPLPSNPDPIVIVYVASYALWIGKRFRKSQSPEQTVVSSWRDGYLRRLSWLHYFCTVMQVSTEQLALAFRHPVLSPNSKTDENENFNGDIQHFWQSWEEWSTKGPAMGVDLTAGFADWPLQEESD